MNTILVPTDFSESAKNAAQYAVQFAQQLKAQKIILYNAYQYPVSADPMLNTVEMYDATDFKKASEEGLKHFKKIIQSNSSENVQIETVSDFNMLSAGIEETCKKYNVDIVLMGITGGGKLEETLVGSNTISVAKQIQTPVIIVPGEAKFNAIKNVLFVCNFKEITETMPVEHLKKILDETRAKLFVLNVNQNSKEFSKDTSFESLMLDKLLQNYAPQYDIIDNADFDVAINQFVEEHNINLIISIPKKHGLFENLFKESDTKKLAFHTHVPLMVMHE